MKITLSHIVAILTIASLGTAHAATFTWDGNTDGDGDNVSLYQEANWTTDGVGTNPAGGTIDPNSDINNALVVNFGTVGGGGAGVDLQLGTGSLTVNGGTVNMQALAGRGIETGSIALNGGTIAANTLISTSLVATGGTLTLRDSTTILNASTVDVNNNSGLVRLTNRTVANFTGTDISGFLVNRASASNGSNIQAIDNAGVTEVTRIANTLTLNAGANDSFINNANWTGSASTGGVIDGGNLIDDFVLDQPAHEFTAVGNMVFEGGTLSVKSGRLGGFSGLTRGNVFVSGGQLERQFTVNAGVFVSGTGTMVYGGGGNPVNVSEVDLVGTGAVVKFNDETVGAFTSEHLSKFTVNGAAGVIDTNLFVAPDNGAAGSEITVLTDYTATVDASGPSAWYKFNESSFETVANNSAGTTVDSTASAGVAFGQLGIQGRTGNFDGTGALTTGFALNVSTSDFTIEMLINPTAITGGDILVQQNDGSGTGRSLLLLNDDGSLNSFYGGSTQALTAAGLVKLGEWAHVVMTVTQDGTNDVINIYVNGILAGTGIEDGEAATGSWILGSSKAGTANYDGLLDEVAFYNSALSAGAIRAHFYAANIPTPAALPAGLAMMIAVAARRRRK